MKNGYTSATGTQEIISTPDEEHKAHAPDKHAKPRPYATSRSSARSRASACSGCAPSTATTSTRCGARFDEAFTTDFAGLKVIIAEGECQLERQRRVKPWLAGLLSAGKRVVRVKYGVDEDICTGDHSCIRLSGCPTLTVKDNPDPLRVDPVATVIDGCVGCGLCGENAHAATLCPSFYRGEVIQNPNWRDRFGAWLRHAVIRLLQPRLRRGSCIDDRVRITILDRARSAARAAACSPNGWSTRRRVPATRRRARRFPASRSAPARRPITSRSFREPIAALGGRRPVLACSRCRAASTSSSRPSCSKPCAPCRTAWSSAERTTLIDVDGRTLTTAEKMPLGDGRFDSDVLLDVARAHSRSLVAFDMAQLARERAPSSAP